MAQYNDRRSTFTGGPLRVMNDPRTIVEKLSCLQVGITTDDIVNPKADRVQTIYHAFCCIILEVPESSMNHLPFDCQGSFDQTEMHHRSVPLNILHSVMRSFVYDYANNQDFTMCDLILPEPKKTKKLLSFLADYVSFHKIANDVFQTISCEFDDARKELDQAREEVARIEEKKRRLIAEADGRNRRENALRGDLTTVASKFNQMMKENEDEIFQTEEIVAQIVQTDKDKEDFQNEIVALNAQLDHLSKEIIQSPERILQELDNQRNQIPDLLKSCDEARNRTKQLQMKIEMSKQVSASINNLAISVQNLVKYRESYEVARMKLIEGESAEAESASVLKELQQNVKIAEENAETALKDHREALEQHNQRVNQLKDRYENINREVLHLKNQEKGIRSETRSLQKEITDMKNAKSDYIRRAKEECHQITNKMRLAVKKYHEEEQLYENAVRVFNEALKNLNAASTPGDLSLADITTVSLNMTRGEKENISMEH